MQSRHYRARHLLLVPGLLSLSRIPLAIVFPLVIGWPVASFSVLAAAALTDVLDGWYARRFHQVTTTGTALDGITDKLFVLSVALTLLLTRHLGLSDVMLLSTREIGELPLVLWYALSPWARHARSQQPSANWAGKFATTLQFVTVSFALLYSPTGASGHLLAGRDMSCATGLCVEPTFNRATSFLIVITACAGALAAGQYWVRALRLKGIATPRRDGEQERWRIS